MCIQRENIRRRYAVILQNVATCILNSYLGNANKDRVRGCITITTRAVGMSENPGVPVLFGEHNLPPWFR